MKIRIFLRVLLHDFSVAHSFVDSGESADNFLHNPFRNLHRFRIFEVLFRKFVEADVWVDFHRVKVLEALDFRWYFTKFLIERVGNIMRRIRRNNQNRLTYLRQLHRKATTNRKLSKRLSRKILSLTCKSFSQLHLFHQRKPISKTFDRRYSSKKAPKFQYHPYFSFCYNVIAEIEVFLT